jgi:hypothetical protein
MLGSAWVAFNMQALLSSARALAFARTTIEAAIAILMRIGAPTFTTEAHNDRLSPRTSMVRKSLQLVRKSQSIRFARCVFEQVRDFRGDRYDRARERFCNKNGDDIAKEDSHRVCGFANGLPAWWQASDCGTAMLCMSHPGITRCHRCGTKRLGDFTSWKAKCVIASSIVGVEAFESTRGALPLGQVLLDIILLPKRPIRHESA